MLPLRGSNTNTHCIPVVPLIWPLVRQQHQHALHAAHHHCCAINTNSHCLAPSSPLLRQHVVHVARAIGKGEDAERRHHKCSKAYSQEHGVVALRGKQSQVWVCGMGACGGCVVGVARVCGWQMVTGGPHWSAPLLPVLQ